jgi:uncharacterized protein
MPNLNIAAPIKDRILTLDIIRGFALFGILLVNTPTLNTPAFMDTQDFGFQTTALDQNVSQFIFRFAMESFYPIFALLFGISAMIFLSKNNANTRMLFWRRMGFLLVVGVLHAIFVWWGDILIVYALLGSLLPFFKDLKPGRLGKMVLSLMMLIFLLQAYQSYLGAEHTKHIWPDTETIYAQGSFLKISAQRAHDYVQVYFQNAAPLETCIYFLGIFTIMLLGMWVQKKAILLDVKGNRSFFIWSTSTSLVLLFAYHSLSRLGFNLEFVGVFKGLCTGIFYISLISLLCSTKSGFKVLKPLSYNGRMSLSNYLGFNIALSLIFYGYGLGLYGSLGPASQMPIVFGLYVGSLVVSAWWLKHFPYGPFELVWRLFTYGRSHLVGAGP